VHGPTWDPFLYRAENLKFKATNLDLCLAFIATFLLPIACWLLLE
jgi:hypothetical protein